MNEHSVLLFGHKNELLDAIAFLGGCKYIIEIGGNKFFQMVMGVSLGQ